MAQWFPAQNGRVSSCIVVSSSKSVKVISPKLLKSTHINAINLEMSEYDWCRSCKNSNKLLRAQGQCKMEGISECNESEPEDGTLEDVDHDHPKALQDGLANINQDIKRPQQNFSQELTQFKSELRTRY